MISTIELEKTVKLLQTDGEKFEETIKKLGAKYNISSEAVVEQIFKQIDLKLQNNRIFKLLLKY